MDTHPIPWNNDYDQFANVLLQELYDVFYYFLKRTEKR